MARDTLLYLPLYIEQNRFRSEDTVKARGFTSQPSMHLVAGTEWFDV